MYVLVEQANTWFVVLVKDGKRTTVAIIPEWYKEKKDREEMAEEIAYTLNVYHGYKEGKLKFHGNQAK